MSVYKFGGSWKYSDQWTFRAGYSFPDSQPIPKTQMEFNILAPGVVEEHFTVGFTRTMSDGNELSLFEHDMRLQRSQVLFQPRPRYTPCLRSCW